MFLLKRIQYKSLLSYSLLLEYSMQATPMFSNALERDAVMSAHHQLRKSPSKIIMVFAYMVVNCSKFVAIGKNVVVQFSKTNLQRKSKYGIGLADYV